MLSEKLTNPHCCQSFRSDARKCSRPGWRHEYRDGEQPSTKTLRPAHGRMVNFLQPPGPAASVTMNQLSRVMMCSQGSSPHGPRPKSERLIDATRPLYWSHCLESQRAMQMPVLGRALDTARLQLWFPRKPQCAGRFQEPRTSPCLDYVTTFSSVVSIGTFVWLLRPKVCTEALSAWANHDKRDTSRAGSEPYPPVLDATVSLGAST